MKKVREIIKDILVAEKVEWIFGHTGDNIIDLWQSIKMSPIKTIFNKTESGAVFMADGYSRVSNKLGVILTTGGPGATNMTTALATAYLDSTPLLAISGGSTTTDIGKNAFQEGSGRGRSIEQCLVFKSVCKKAMLAPSAQAVPDMLEDALREALCGRPGPVYLEVPSDFWNTEVNYKHKTINQYKNLQKPHVNKNSAQLIIKQLLEASRPIVIIGEGAYEGEDCPTKIMHFINTIQIPFCVTPLGKNLVDEYHDCYLGAGYNTQMVSEYLKTCDFVLQIGSRPPPDYFSSLRHDKINVAQIDSDPNEIGRSYPVDYSCIGSAISFLQSAPLRKHKNSVELLKMVAMLKIRFEKHHINNEPKTLKPRGMDKIVKNLAPDNAIIVCDTGYTKARIIGKYRTRLKQKVVVSDKNGCMGFSIPAALGAAIATENEVICFCGDGGFQMSINELGTAMNHGLQVIFIVENNGGCRSIADFNMSTYSNYCVDLFENPNFSLIAESYGMKGFSVKTEQQFMDCFSEGLRQKCSVIIEAHID